jgi:hypothetical protein
MPGGAASVRRKAAGKQFDLPSLKYISAAASGDLRCCAHLVRMAIVSGLPVHMFRACK